MESLAFLFDGSLGPGPMTLLLVSLTIALGFEFVNGFHDTANAVATVIYTNTLRPRRAVVWSGICNFLGVYFGGTAVAYSIVRLLPVDVLVEVGSGSGSLMVLAMLTAAILWNLGTWYLALPASSSHTLVGAILGVGLTHSAIYTSAGQGVHWPTAVEVGLSLLVSPLVGFTSAAALLLLLKRVLPDPTLYTQQSKDAKPPRWIRGTLILTCTGVSFAHGSNDGQKGIGLIMLILIGIMPYRFALDHDAGPAEIRRSLEAARELGALIDEHAADPGVPAEDVEALREGLAEVAGHLEGLGDLEDLPREARWEVRGDILQVDDLVNRLSDRRSPLFPERDRRRVERLRKEFRSITEYAPTWVMLAVALSLGIGTMVGWRRIVTTIGERIGKAHLTYGQGAVAEVVAMTTIGAADLGGLPVSTTHVLSSGVAGTMAANGNGVQVKTVRSIALAWVLTMPAAMLLSSTLFLAFLAIGRLIR